MSLLQENRELLASFRAGEPAALREIYFHYVKKIELLVAYGWYDPKNGNKTYGMADFEIQRDLVQEIFMRAFSEKARSSYDGVRPFRTFLLSIARNVIIDYIRKKPTDALSHAFLSLNDDEVNLDQEEFMRQVGEKTRSNEADIDWQRASQATQAYLNTFDGRWKEFIDLRFHQELSIVEVARRMGVTRGKARYWEQDVARLVRKHLQSLEMSTKSKGR